MIVDPYFSATKIEWLRERVPGLARRVAAGEAVFGTIDTWLLFRLTNGQSYATDHTNASRTMLYNITAHAWDDVLLGLFGVRRDALPEIRGSSGAFGVCAAEHLGAEIPIAGIAGDQQAALFGQGCVAAGQAKNTYGTGALLLLNTGKRRAKSTRGLLTTIACAVRPTNVCRSWTGNNHVQQKGTSTIRAALSPSAERRVVEPTLRFAPSTFPSPPQSTFPAAAAPSHAVPIPLALRPTDSPALLPR